MKLSTPRDQYRLTVVRDGNFVVTQNLIEEEAGQIDFILTSQDNRGLGPSINSAIAHIGTLKAWDSTYVPLTCYVQDDVIFKQGWLEKLSSKFIQLHRPLNLGFASGHSAVEHVHDTRADTRKIGHDMYTSKYIRATCMMAMHDYWQSMCPIPRIDPEIGRERGRPHDGLGSGVDWHFIRVHQNSVYRTGRTNLIIPGLVMHNGYRKSTWLKRELPESDSDKVVIGG